MSKVGQARARIKGVEKEAVDSKDDMMPSLSKVVYQVSMRKGVLQGAKGQEIEGFFKWKKMHSVLGEESFKVETSLYSLLKCKDDYRVDLLVHNGHDKDRKKLVDDANVKLLELQLALDV